MILVMEAQGRGAQDEPFHLFVSAALRVHLRLGELEKGSLQQAARTRQRMEVTRIRLLPPFVRKPQGMGPRPQWPQVS